MVDISGKLAQIKEMVDEGCYFTINRARQYGKTTTLSALRRLLNDEYTVASINFEGLGINHFSKPEIFCPTFIKIVEKALRVSSVSEEIIAKWANSNATDFMLLSDHITDMCKDTKMVLLIDEVDKTSHNQVFLEFLSMLRTKFLASQDSSDYTFHSIILAGVYDIKNIKLKMIKDGTHIPALDESKVYNSPWNIATDFEVDMSFSPSEIASMLSEYEQDHNTGMCIKTISGEIYNYTSGYPFLVSRICQCIDKKLERMWTPVGVQNAVRVLLDETSTLFDDIFKNLENNLELRQLVYDILILGDAKQFFAYDSVISIGIQYGFFKRDAIGGNVKISNKIFEQCMTRFLISRK